MSRLITLLLSTVLLTSFAGCAVVPGSAEEAALRGQPERPKVHTDLVRAMLAQNQNHAALAHIEALEKESGSDKQQLLWLRAQAQYKLGDLEESEQNYRRLLNGPYAGQAWHGLGLIAARSDLRTAVKCLNRAVQRRPTDGQIRNDLGYTLLLAGRLTEARHHLATATELAANDVQAQNNLVLSYLLDGQQQQADGLARSFAMDAQGMRQLQAQAKVMRRMMAQRAQEFEQPLSADQADWAEPEKQSHEKTKTQSDNRPLPGLYRNPR